MTKQFNFNHEEHVTHFELDNETGRVSFEVQGITQEFASVQELAEFYATARGVTPDKLKNWTLIEDGDYYAFVLRAATAGNDFFNNGESRDFFRVDRNTYEEDYDEEDYDDEDTTICWEELTNSERKVLIAHTVEVTNYEEVEAVLNGELDSDGLEYAQESIYDNDSLYNEIVEKVEEYTEFGNGNFDLGFAVKLELTNIQYASRSELFERTQAVKAEANKQLIMASIARRADFQVFNCDISNERIVSEFRPTSRPFGENELVLKCVGRIVVFKR